MLQSEKIQQAIDRIVSVASQPSKVILFGSYARGDAGEHSDLDIMVVEPVVADRAQEMMRLQQAIGWIGVDVDVLVYSEAEFEQRKNWCSTPVYWALREGKVVYEHRQ
ncbi:MAG: nucleotidyltransferase domain-containing protein [Nitrosomonadales bacterium]|nr:nucleotidyltransferase domain-containing protein [Nitrosomonadales bacterium]